jgi:aconitase A
MTHDNTGAVLKKFLQVGATKVHSAAQLVYTLDHDVQNTSPANLKKYADIEAFAAEQGVSFYPKGRGIGHQVSNLLLSNPTPDLPTDYGGGRVCLAGHHGRGLG